jgi:RHS repeat-associated protein
MFNHCELTQVRRAFWPLPALLVFANMAFTQNTITVTDGTTPAALAPGSPSSSYPLSEFEHYSPYSGKMNLVFPMHHVGGRGAAGFEMVLKINSAWTAEKLLTPNPPHVDLFPTWWSQGGTPVYGPGSLVGRESATFATNCTGPPPSPIAQTTLGRLTFTAPDGTETELRDANTDGKPYSIPNFCQNTATSWDAGRGTVFVSRDSSAMTFVADATVMDFNPETTSGVFDVNGNLLFRDGSTYRIDAGNVSWIRDRNGNKISFTYNISHEVTQIQDQNDRTITVTYSDTTCAGSASLCDHINYPGTSGISRSIEIGYLALGSALRSGFSLETYSQLFPEAQTNNNSTFNPSVVSYLRYPNGAQFKILYNSYGEPARVILPTGGAIEYDMSGLLSGSSGFVGNPTDTNSVMIYRLLATRREYSNGSTLSASTQKAYSYATGGTVGTQTTTETFYDSSGTTVTQTVHGYYGDPVNALIITGTAYDGWQEGKEFQTQWGSPVLKTQANTWQQIAVVTCGSSCFLGGPPENPAITTVQTTLNDTSQVAELDYGYDAYNNVTSKQEKDYGTGAAGSLIRQTTTTYVTATAYTSPNVNLVSLPIQEIVTNGSTVISQTQWCYDNGQGAAGASCSSSSLQNDSNIVGHDSTFGTGYTTRGNVTTLSRWLSTTNSYLPATNTYDVAGNVLSATDRNGNTTTYSYTDQFTTGTTLPGGQATYGFVTNVTLPSTTGFSYSQKYDYYLGRPTQFTDINGIITNVMYESAANLLDRPLTVDRGVGVTADEAQTNYAYCDSTCNPSQTVTKFNDQVNVGDKLLQAVTVYDGLGRVAETRQYEDSSHYISAQTKYDSLGRVYQVSNPTRSANLPPTQWTTTVYDTLNRVKTVTTPDGSATGIAYSGNQTTTTDPSQRARTSAADALGRVTLMVEDPTGLNYQTKYSYDGLDNLTQVCQNFSGACGETRTFQYDSLSRLTSAANPEAKNLATTYTYDKNGNLATKTDANGVITCYGSLSGSTCTFSNVGYDSLNRLLKKSYSDTGTSTVTYTYDSVSKGRLSSVANGVSTTSYTAYDSLGHVKASSQSTNGQAYNFTSYTYNRAGAMTSVTYPSTRVVNTNYDGADRVSLVSSGTTNYATLTTTPSQAIYAYTPHGAIQQMSLANGLVAVATPYSTDRMQPQSVSVTVGSTTPLSLGLYYCPNKGLSCTTNNGNLTTQTMATLRQDYGYDKANRLTSAAETGGSSEWSQSYGYDAYGNRWVSASSGYTLSSFTPTTSSFFDAYNRLNLTVGSAYDNPGNQTQQGGYTQAYDAENHVKSSTISSATTTYSYDGDGRRVMKVSGGVTTVYVYDAQGQLAAEYATAITGSPCRTCYRIEDHLGSTRLVTDGNGNTVSQHDYLPWGEEIPTGVGGRGTAYGATDSSTQRFTGKERDAETGFDFFGARYMSSAQSRFTSADPYEVVVQKNKGKTAQEQASLLNSFISNPQAWNKYAYGLNNPLKNIDVGGHCSAPAGLKGGQTGVCIEAFISAKRFGPLDVALGDGRKVDPNGGTYRVRGDVRIDPGSNGQISTNSDVAKSSVIVEGLGLRGTGGVALVGAPTTYADGNRHFTIVGQGTNGFEGAPLAPKGDISFKIDFTVDPSGNVSIDSVTGRTFPSLEVFSYQPDQTPQLLFTFSENKIEDLQKPQKRLDQ